MQKEESRGREQSARGVSDGIGIVVWQPGGKPRGFCGCHPASCRLGPGELARPEFHWHPADMILTRVQSTRPAKLGVKITSGPRNISRATAGSLASGERKLSASPGLLSHLGMNAIQDPGEPHGDMSYCLPAKLSARANITHLPISKFASCVLTCGTQSGTISPNQRTEVCYANFDSHRCAKEPFWPCRSSSQRASWLLHRRQAQPGRPHFHGGLERHTGISLS